MPVTEDQAEEFHISSQTKQTSDFSNMEVQIIQHRVCTQICVSSQRTSPGFTSTSVARKAFGLDISRKSSFLGEKISRRAYSHNVHNFIFI